LISNSTDDVKKILGIFAVEICVLQPPPSSIQTERIENPRASSHNMTEKCPKKTGSPLTQRTNALPHPKRRIVQSEGILCHGAVQGLGAEKNSQKNAANYCESI
jgi:hypothetical protein